MSLQIKTIASLVAALFFAAIGWKIYLKGRDAGRAEIQMKWDQQVQSVEKASRAMAEVQQKIITKTVTKFVEKAAQERIVYRDIIKEVENYVPITLSMLPSDFRLLHDAAATGSPLPEAGDTARTTATPVPPKDVAFTVADNYEACRYDQGRLEVLQKIVNMQHK
jgi:hypothetical protein